MNKNRPLAIICDIDGTVALKGDRDPYDWTRVIEDAPNTPVISAVRMHQSCGFKAIFVSGRMDCCRMDTWRWLRRFGLTEFGEPILYMRATGDTRSDVVVKSEIYRADIEPEWNVRVVFDDRNSVVKMWREKFGLTVFQVAEGDF